MSVDDAIRLAREALLLAVELSALPVLAALVVGLVVSLFQAATQINEQTLSFAPKIVAVYAAILFGGSALFGVFLHKATEWLQQIASFGG